MANAQVNVEFIPHARDSYLVVNGFRYVVKMRRRTNESELVYWKCAVKNCNGTVNTRDNIPTAFPKAHNHEADIADITSQKFLHQLKRKCADTLYPLPSIYEEEITKLRDHEWDESLQEVVEHIPTFESYRGSMYRHRNNPSKSKVTCYCEFRR